MKRRIGAQATLRRTPLALLIAIACASGPVAAQDDDATALERIEVTGDLRALMLPVKGSPKLVINGKEQPAAISAGVLSFSAR